jgi:hypothetical protein
VLVILIYHSRKPTDPIFIYCFFEEAVRISDCIAPISTVINANGCVGTVVVYRKQLFRNSPGWAMNNDERIVGISAKARTPEQALPAEPKRSIMLNRYI